MDKLAALKEYFGYDSFRPGQEALVDALLFGRDAMGVMPTGAGKSLCYQLPAALGGGVSIVISPLISLMKDQVSALRLSGIPAAYINSSLTPAQCELALSRAAQGAYRIMYVAPERLDSASFIEFARSARVPLVVVDEAHCISQWGQDFRPSYLKIADFIGSLPVRPAVGAFTATATAAVREDIISSLALQNPVTLVTGFDRPNLRFAVERPEDKLGFVTRYIAAHGDVPGIIYCATRKTVEEVCARLEALGLPATRYHAGLTDGERLENQDDFRLDRKRIMVATNAFGMGIDKSNVAYVIHYNMPKCIESYYQEAGRAGRDGADADCILLYAKKDVATAKWLIKNGGANPGLDDETRAAVIARDLERLSRMMRYCTTRRCLRAFILDYFGESSGRSCGNCGNCDPGAPNLGGYAVTAVYSREHPMKPAVNAELLEALRELRAEIADERGVPAYMVFTNVTLEDMAKRKPLTMEAFLNVSGVGAYKQAQYGPRFLDRIRLSLGCDVPDEAPKVSRRKKRARRERYEQKGVGQAFLRWDADEEERLKREFGEGLGMAEIARRHARSARAVRMRLVKLGLIDE